MRVNPTGEIPIDAAHRCLANERRRRVIDYLRETEDGTATLDELRSHVIQRSGNYPAPDRETVTCELYHVHLPMLADNGVITFDRRTETANYQTPEVIERLLDAA